MTDDGTTGTGAAGGVGSADAAPAPETDPMKGFRGVQAGTLVIEAIVVALALPVVGTLGDGITSFQGWTVMAVVAALVVLCGFLTKPWAIGVVLSLHAVLLVFVVALPSIAVIGLVFLGVWLWLLWLRRDVSRRMAEGTLPSQQQG
ncbi:DUF4233 domain-containing protein [Prauserella halophila]|uniref:DUF4233 domain-containing protein n=1 Tax=Prauserella halophila TaxID=185641 RepID=A0ABP4H0M8_9PSEU|nr:Protein of unknown function (DUF4233) [Prauserella halophila]